MSKSHKKALEILFQRPLEPVFTVRDDGNACFQLPDSYYTEQYRNNKELVSRAGDDVDFKIPIRELEKMPNLDFANKLGPREAFSLFNEQHQQIASELIEIFLNTPNLDNFLESVIYCKDRVNPMLFQYCYAVAVGHHKDTHDIMEIPPVLEVFPGNFFDAQVIKEAQKEASLIGNPSKRSITDITAQPTASEREDESRLAYFREDIAVNSHHWHWHLVYPGVGPARVVAKDRRGELFYYMHHQIIARYNIERFCNDLSRVVPLSNLREPVPEGYFPKLMNTVMDRTYPARTANHTLLDINRGGSIVTIDDIERWRNRILNAIDIGYVEDSKGNRIPLDDVSGIDILGDIVEATSLSKNRKFYGNLHNQVHNIIALSHDPENLHLESNGVMGDPTTAMRDPIFYRWHEFVDGIFNTFKVQQPVYKREQLGFDGIIVDYVDAKIDSGNAPDNTLLTYWQKSAANLAAGLNFASTGNIFAAFTHLQHEAFTYTININNTTGIEKRGTCRIFLCPKVDELNKALTYEDVRKMAIELDKFTVDLNPGQNTLQRKSTESSLTIPFERTFRQFKKLPSEDDAAEAAEFGFCGCGWPQHLLLPKGKSGNGMLFDLFVMISDYEGDAVQQHNKSTEKCRNAASFCGLKDKLYPDKRSMGFPFDRPLPGENLEKLIEDFTNMATTNLSIIFNDRIVDKTQ